MGAAKEAMIEQMEKEQNTCPDCDKEFRSVPSKFQATANKILYGCDCGVFTGRCQECGRGMKENDGLVCSDCFSDICDND